VRVEELDADRTTGPPGESPEHLFRLSPRRPGEVVLSFEQRRPWEPDQPARDSRRVEVIVTE
jgi:hypothetical protein